METNNYKYNYTKTEDLNTQKWFHGKLPKEDLSHIFAIHCKNGAFLVQDSLTRPGEYTLCVLSDGKIRRYPIIKANCSYTIDEEVYHPSITRLVEYYREHEEYILVKLTYPVSRQDGLTAATCLKKIYNEGYLIDYKELCLTNPPEIIGKGEFGEVVLAEYHSNIVAVKILKHCDLPSFMTEIDLTLHLHHPNIVQVKGISYNHTSLYIVSEYMRKGSLLQYLQSRGRKQISQSELLKFASDVCAGMEYMESKHIVHRDLAARNVLIGVEMIAKVADFGLAQTDQMCPDNNRIPIRWSAPEAFRDKKFTSKSDVWSFGIVLWEIYSFGQHPYARMPSEDLLNHITNGFRMKPPNECPEDICDLMIRTWNIEPEKRPSFSELNVMLIQLCAAQHLAARQQTKL